MPVNNCTTSPMHVPMPLYIAFNLQAGDWIGSASDDGTALACSVHTDDTIHYPHHRPVKAIRLAPDFGRNRERPVITGGIGGKFRMLKRGWLLGNITEKLIHEGEGPIRACAWLSSQSGSGAPTTSSASASTGASGLAAGTLVAWANDAGVKVYDHERDERICFVEAPPDTPHPDICPPRLVWENERSLLIAWGDCVRVVTLRDRRVPIPKDQYDGAVAAPGAEAARALANLANAVTATLVAEVAGGNGSAGDEGPQQQQQQDVVYIRRRYADITCRMSFDAYICGIAPYGEDLALLCYEPGANAGDAPIIDLRIVPREGGSSSSTGGHAHDQPKPAPTSSSSSAPQTSSVTNPAPLCRDVLSLRGLEASHGPADFSLSCDHDSLVGSDGLPLLFVSSPRDIVCAQPRGVGDHVEWEAARGNLAEAVAVALAYPSAVPAARVVDLIGLYIRGLLAEGKSVQAAAACTRLLRDDDVHAWEGWAQHFLEACDTTGKDAIVDVLPLPHGIEWTRPGLLQQQQPVPPSPLEAEAALLQQQQKQQAADASTSASATAAPPPPRPRVRLSAPVYEACMRHLLSSHPQSFLSAVRGWALHGHWIDRQRQQQLDMEPNSAAATDTSIDGGEGSAAVSKPKRRFGRFGFGSGGKSSRGIGGILNPQALVDKAVALAKEQAKTIAETVVDTAVAGGSLLSQLPGKMMVNGGAANAANSMIDIFSEDPSENGDGAIAGPQMADVTDVAPTKAAVEPLFRVEVALQMVQEAIQGVQAQERERIRLSNQMSYGMGTNNSAGSSIGQQNIEFQILAAVDPCLWDALAELFVLDGQPDKALRVYLDLAQPQIQAQAARAAEQLRLNPTLPGSSALTAASSSAGGSSSGSSDSYGAHVFSLITEHRLYQLVTDRVTILALMELNLQQALQLFSTHMDIFPPPQVMDACRNRPELQHAYLHRLFTHKRKEYDISMYDVYHELQLTLYARFDLPGLLPFLQGCGHYPLEAARQLCMEGGWRGNGEGEGSGTSGRRDASQASGTGKSSGSKQPGGAAGPSSSQQQPAPLYRELVYVLGRMGNVREAVAILLEQLRDVPGAVTFVAGFEDDGLWTELVARALKSNSGEVVGQLLASLPNTPLNPLKVIPLIPNNMRIPHLQSRLLAILRDRKLARDLIETCGGMVQRDMFGLVSRLATAQRQGLWINTEADKCALCTQALTDPAPAKKRGGGSGSGNERGRSRTRSGADDADGGDDGDDDDSEHGHRRRHAHHVDPAVLLFRCRHMYHDTCLKEYLAHQRERERERSNSGSIFGVQQNRRRSSVGAVPSGAGAGKAAGAGGQGAALSGGWGAGLFRSIAGSPVQPRKSSSRGVSFAEDKDEKGGKDSGKKKGKGRARSSSSGRHGDAGDDQDRGSEGGHSDHGHHPAIDPATARCPLCSKGQR